MTLRRSLVAALEVPGRSGQQSLLCSSVGLSESVGQSRAVRPGDNRDHAPAPFDQNAAISCDAKGECSVIGTCLCGLRSSHRGIVSAQPLGSRLRRRAEVGSVTKPRATRARSIATGRFEIPSLEPRWTAAARGVRVTAEGQEFELLPVTRWACSTNGRHESDRCERHLRVRRRRI
jgi:hypothetical protein